MASKRWMRSLRIREDSASPPAKLLKCEVEDEDVEEEETKKAGAPVASILRGRRINKPGSKSWTRRMSRLPSERDLDDDEKEIEEAARIRGQSPLRDPQEDWELMKKLRLERLEIERTKFEQAEKQAKIEASQRKLARSAGCDREAAGTTEEEGADKDRRMRDFSYHLQCRHRECFGDASDDRIKHLIDAATAKFKTKYEKMAELVANRKSEDPSSDAEESDSPVE